MSKLPFAPEEQHVYSIALRRNMALRRSAMWAACQAINMLLLRSKTTDRGPCTVLHRLIRLRLLCGFFSFQLGELLFGLYVAGLIAERSQP